MTTEEQQIIQDLSGADKIRMEAFVEEYPSTEENYLWLATLAAFPPVLTPDLLYKIWLNFSPKSDSATSKPSSVAVSDILMSPICREVARGTYEIYRSIKQVLLFHLKSNYANQIHRLSHFLKFYVQDNPSRIPSVAFKEAQEIWALANTDPKQAAEFLMKKLGGSDGKITKGRLLDVSFHLEPINKFRQSAMTAEQTGRDPLFTLASFIKRLKSYQYDGKSVNEAFDDIKDIIQPYVEGSGKIPLELPQEVLDFVQPQVDVERKTYVLGIGIDVYVDYITDSNGTRLVSNNGQALTTVSESIPQLFQSVNNVEAFINTLDNFYEIEGYIKLYNEQATKSSILETFDNLINQLTENDNLIIYFSGHFEDFLEYAEEPSEKNSRNEFWLTHKGGKLLDDGLYYFLKRIKAKNILIISDVEEACNSDNKFEYEGFIQSFVFINDLRARKNIYTIASQKDLNKKRNSNTRSYFSLTIENKVTHLEQIQENILVPDFLKNLYKDLFRLALSNQHKIINDLKDSFVLQLKPEEDRNWIQVKDTKDIEALKNYISIFPNSKHIQEAKKLLEDLQWEAAREKNTEEAFKAYIEEYPKGKYITEASTQIHEIKAEFWKSLKQLLGKNKIEEVIGYLLEYDPNQTIIQLRNRYVDLEDQKRRSIISFDTYQISSTKIVYIILEYIKEQEEKESIEGKEKKTISDIREKEIGLFRNLLIKGKLEELLKSCQEYQEMEGFLIETEQAFKRSKEDFLWNGTSIHEHMELYYSFVNTILIYFEGNNIYLYEQHSFSNFIEKWELDFITPHFLPEKLAPIIIKSTFEDLSKLLHEHLDTNYHVIRILSTYRYIRNLYNLGLYDIVASFDTTTSLYKKLLDSYEEEEKSILKGTRLDTENRPILHQEYFNTLDIAKIIDYAQDIIEDLNEKKTTWEKGEWDKIRLERIKKITVRLVYFHSFYRKSLLCQERLLSLEHANRIGIIADSHYHYQLQKINQQVLEILFELAEKFGDRYQVLIDRIPTKTIEEKTGFNFDYSLKLNMFSIQKELYPRVENFTLKAKLLLVQNIFIQSVNNRSNLSPKDFEEKITECVKDVLLIMNIVNEGKIHFTKEHTVSIDNLNTFSIGEPFVVQIATKETTKTETINLKFTPNDEEIEAWRKAMNDDSVQGYEAFLDDYPNSNFSEGIKERLEESRETELWRKILNENNLRLSNKYIDDFPNGQYIDQVTKLNQELLSEFDFLKRNFLEIANELRRFSFRNISYQRVINNLESVEKTLYRHQLFDNDLNEKLIEFLEANNRMFTTLIKNKKKSVEKKRTEMEMDALYLIYKQTPEYLDQLIFDSEPRLKKKILTELLNGIASTYVILDTI